jgi:predicted RNase H-like HicB family nuclease
MMPANLFALIALIFIGCASKVQQTAPVQQPAPAPVECKADEFRGAGTGESEDEALGEARSALARQINSSVNVTIERVVNQQISNGKEILNSEYESRTIIEAALPNAHDARIAGSSREENKINIVVCMTKADAAKGFLERQRLVADSLGLISSAMLGTEHPRHKNGAWRKTQILWNEFMKIQYLLEGWGIGSSYLANDIYSKAREDYRNYCQDMKIFWQDAGNECSMVVFAMLSKKIKMEKSRCSGGLKLSFDCVERCKSSSFGIECSFEPFLAIESCGRESYSLLKTGVPAIGNDVHSTGKAREKLLENLPDAAFLNEWEKELKEWVPQCAD